MSIVQRLLTGLGRQVGALLPLPGESSQGGTEIGRRTTPENQLAYLYRQMTVDPQLRAAILEIRRMDRLDGRVKKLHGRMARAAVKGGLKLMWSGPENRRINALWSEFQRRLSLHNQLKRESDARGLAMEGNLALQWVLGPEGRVARAVRMPSETLVPQVTAAGVFKDVGRAYAQYDLLQGRVIAEFALWQLSLGRLDPDNYDDWGSMGRPYLDATRPCWRKLVMTEEDLVIRRRHRAPLRTAHVLEGASKDDLEAYQLQVEADESTITTNYYLNRKGAVTAVQGDANLDQIADVVHLLDTFMTGAPAPKGLFGYADGLSRDVLEDMKKDFFEELDAMQDQIAGVYHEGFRLDCLLAGVNPDNYQFQVGFSERQTESPTQATDRALKLLALGVPRRICWETARVDVGRAEALIEEERRAMDPYPEPDNIVPINRVSITPGNARKGESATTVATRSPA